MPIIEAIQDTFLKTQDKDTSQLTDAQKYPIRKGTKIACTVADIPSTSSLFITIAGPIGATLKTGQRFFVYEKHWLINGQLFTIAENPVTTSSSGGLITKIIPSKKDYVLQPNASLCQSAAIAMITGGDVWAIREALTRAGTAGDPNVMAEYLKPRVKEYALDLGASLNDMRKAIDMGYQLINHGVWTGSGHVIKISGYEANPANLSMSFICDDPWSGFYPKGWTYSPYDASGNNIRYSAHTMYAACVTGQSPYDAAQIFNRGELDSNRGGMWLHAIKN